MNELRYERLHPAELREAVERAPIAYLPIGTLEFHGEHLPFGVDSFEAHGLCRRAAAFSGGVVLPPVYLASGCLDLPFTLSFEHELVERWVTATIDQLAHRGFRVVVALSGHGPLDLTHLLKRVCEQAQQRHRDLAAYGLCWLELNAAALSAEEDDEPTCVDRAARVETSWMLALEPDLVRTERLADDPLATHLGVYGANPRFTASAQFGERQIAAAAHLLAQRASGLLAETRFDPLADLRAFVTHGWPERLLLLGRSGPEPRLLLRNPGRASRYISALGIELDGTAIDPSVIVLRNDSVGETGAALRASELGPERGFHVRRRRKQRSPSAHARSPRGRIACAPSSAWEVCRAS